MILRHTSNVLTLWLTLTGAAALLPQDSSSRPLDGKTRAEVIDALARELNRGYIFPDKAIAMETELRARLKQGAYDAIVEPASLHGP